MTDKSEIENFIARVRPYPVKRLYRYRSMESRGLEELFKKREIYLPNSTVFNDPFECRPSLTVHKGSISRAMYLKEIFKNKYPSDDKRTIKKRVKEANRKLLTDQDFLEEAYKDVVKAIGILCLSEKNADILMWSHYSNAHHGICLEFDSSKEGTLFGEALKVNYQGKYPEVNIMDMGNPEEVLKAILTKADYWQYEQEWRIWKTEQERGSGIYPFEPELLTGIILGALISDDDRKKLLDWISEYPSKINLYKARISRTKYELDIEPISLA